MEVLFTHCAGLDVHKKTVVACVLVPDPKGGVRKVTRTFATTLAGLEDLARWLLGYGVTHVVMESTGVYWKPVYNVLAPQCEVWLVNAQHVKQVPGRKTDVRDAEWLAQLMRLGLLARSFIPDVEQRDLRDLTRYRTRLGAGTGHRGQPPAEDPGGCQHQAGVRGQRHPGRLGARHAGGVDRRRD